MTKGFVEILAPYPDEKIVKGFKIWLGDNSTMPTPADIKKTIETWCSLDRQVLQIEQAQSGPGGYHNLTDEQKAEFDKLIQDLKKNQPEEQKTPHGDRSKENYTHYERTPQAAHEEFVKAHKRLTKTQEAA